MHGRRGINHPSGVKNDNLLVKVFSGADPVNYLGEIGTLLEIGGLKEDARQLKVRSARMAVA